MTSRGSALPDLRFAWRGELADDELFALTRSHGGNAVPGWWDRIRLHSLGWVTVRLQDGTLVGFVNVAWDGGDHAFLLDPKVTPDHQRRGGACGFAPTHAGLLQLTDAV